MLDYDLVHVVVALEFSKTEQRESSNRSGVDGLDKNGELAVRGDFNWARFWTKFAHDFSKPLRCLFIYNISYRTKIRRTKLSKFRLGVETFVQRKILSVEHFF